MNSIPTPLTLFWLILFGHVIGSPTPEQASAEDVKRLFDIPFSEVSGSEGECDVYLPPDTMPALAAPLPAEATATPDKSSAESKSSAETGSPSGTNQSDDSTAGEDSKRPVVMVVHGGGWVTGDKWTMGNHCQRLAQQGYVVVNVNYRLAPTHKFPAQVDDVRTAMLWVKEHADEYRIDLNRIGIFGYSAGGHLSTLIAVLADEPIQTRAAASSWKVDDPRWKELPRIKTVCVGGPPCDFRVLPPQSVSLSFFLGGTRAELPEVYELASPTAQVSAGDPPIQIYHGATDFLVPIESSRAFKRAMDANGAVCKLQELPDQGHIVTFNDERTKETMIRWFAKTL
ncbi:MAG: alpha/beta hydrolase [Planctomycetota bacterium]